ncbi:MAG: lipoyl(octanoyl) transferase LipB [Deltaproteobacteria bacterium]|nr:lipoyl(octanoyl) transferase LipB [Deltaproteobacteria bacterium]
MTGTLPPAPARVLDLGRMAYAEAWEIQKTLLLQRQNDEIVDTLVLVEHPEVVTLGRGSHAENVLDVAGIPVFEVERGGDVTYHGPGQLVGYLIFKLREGERDLHRYLRNMEEALILGCAQLGLVAGRNPGWTGVWTESEPRRKLVSMGVACRKWVTFHGFALNVSTDLSRFAVINPCGLEAQVMGSLSSVLGRDVNLQEVKAFVIEGVAAALGRYIDSNLAQTPPNTSRET